MGTSKGGAWVRCFLFLPLKIDQYIKNQKSLFKWHFKSIWHSVNSKIATCTSLLHSACSFIVFGNFLQPVWLKHTVYQYSFGKQKWAKCSLENLTDSTIYPQELLSGISKVLSCSIKRENGGNHENDAVALFL